jgi:uracil-DNA glycosylase
MFFCTKWSSPPPSLINIFKELHDDVGVPIPNHGNLTHWAEQGVFLLNASLTCSGKRTNESFKDRLGSIYRYSYQNNSLKKKNMLFFYCGEICTGKKSFDR